MFLPHFSITIKLTRSTLLLHDWQISNLHQKEIIAYSVKVSFRYLISKLGSQFCKANNVMGSLTFRVRRQLIVKLDPLRHLWSRCRDGLQSDESFKVTLLLNPTQSVLKGCWNIIIDDLTVKVDEIGPKPDAKEEIEMWMRENCQWARCKN